MISPDDRDSIASLAEGYRSVMAKLTPSERGVMLRALNDPTPGLAGFLCRDVRDCAIRAMASHSAGAISAVAKWVAKELGDYAANAWLRERDAGPSHFASELRRLQYEILFANGGATLSWRQILTILER